jgi:hypothetical protein
VSSRPIRSSPKEKEKGKEMPKAKANNLKLIQANAISDEEAKETNERARMRLAALDRMNWRELAEKCFRISGMTDSRERQNLIATLFLDMHDTDTELDKYLQRKGFEPIGEFDETAKGVVQPEILWDDDDTEWDGEAPIFREEPEIEA